MIVRVEWMDGEERVFHEVDSYGTGCDHVLRLYRKPVVGRLDGELLAELPIFHIRSIGKVT